MELRRSLCVLTLAAALLSIAFGCGSGGVKLYKYSGKVSLDGQPVANANIHFEPEGEGETKGLPADAQTGSDGAYPYISTKTTGDGIAAGKYKVTISKVSGGAVTDAPPAPAGDMKDPKVMADMMKQAWKNQGKQKTAPKLTNELPAKYSNMEATPLKAEIPASSSTIDFPLQK